MRPELILWDWNGTLLDDVALCVDALNRLLARYGYPQRYDRDQYRAIFGFPVQDYYARAVMIGDSTHDFEVACALDVPCVLQSAGHQPPEVLRRTGAPVVPGLREAAKLILEGENNNV